MVYLAELLFITFHDCAFVEKQTKTERLDGIVSKGTHCLDQLTTDGYKLISVSLQSARNIPMVFAKFYYCYVLPRGISQIASSLKGFFHALMLHMST